MLRANESLQLDLSPEDGRYVEATSSWVDSELSVLLDNPLEILLAIEDATEEFED